MLQLHRSLAALPFVSKNVSWAWRVIHFSLQDTIRACRTRRFTTLGCTRQISYPTDWSCTSLNRFNLLNSASHGLLPSRCYVACHVRHLNALPQRGAFNLQYYRTFKSQAYGEQTRAWDRQEVHIAVGGSGSVTAEVFSLAESQSAADAESRREFGSFSTTSGSNSHNQNLESQLSSSKQKNVLLVYLPPGPVPLDSTGDMDSEFGELLSGLARNTDLCPGVKLQIVKINYRLEGGPKREGQEQDLRFPIPVHDVTTCFQAISNYKQLSALLNEGTFTSTSAELDDRPEVYVVGNHIGGSLALTLALTKPLHIDAVAAIDPVVDWVGLDEIAAMKTSDEDTDIQDDSYQHKKHGVSSRRRRSLKSESIRVQRRAAKAMIDLRSYLFRTPSGFFDQFASPILFVRAPGKDTPLWRSARPEVKDSDVTGNAETFGPYDDDWHAVHHENIDRGLYVEQEELARSSAGINASLNTQEQIANNISPTFYQDIISAHGPNLEEVAQSLFVSPELNAEDETLKPVRRIKNLRRWPSVRFTEEVLLPHVRIFSKEPPSITSEDHADKLDLTYLLHPQAKEMADVMRRACFWGREKSLAEERVTLVMYKSEKQHEDGVEEQADGGSSTNSKINRLCDWLAERMSETPDK